MSGSEKKSSYANDMTSQELCVLLRELADEIEGKSVEVRQSLKNFQKLTLKLKRNGERIFVDVKIRPDRKLPQSAKKQPDESGRGRLKNYKAIKKRIKNGFKDISDSLAKGALPGSDLVASFFRDSDLMVSFPDHGKKYYNAYIEACEAFRAALNIGDLAAVQASCEKIRRIKTECHKKHK